MEKRVSKTLLAVKIEHIVNSARNSILALYFRSAQNCFLFREMTLLAQLTRRAIKHRTYDIFRGRAPLADNSTCRYHRARGHTCLLINTLRPAVTRTGECCLRCLTEQAFSVNSAIHSTILYRCRNNLIRVTGDAWPVTGRAATARCEPGIVRANKRSTGARGPRGAAANRSILDESSSSSIGNSSPLRSKTN